MSEKKQYLCSHKRGSPDFIIEIQSPSTATKDLREKHGVKEFRVVSAEQEIVMAFALTSRKRYGKPAVFSKEETAGLSAFKGLQVGLVMVFESKSRPLVHVLRQKAHQPLMHQSISLRCCFICRKTSRNYYQIIGVSNYSVLSIYNTPENLYRYLKVQF